MKSIRNGIANVLNYTGIGLIVIGKFLIYGSYGVRGNEFKK